jgi:hypothetical protein
MDHIMSQVQNGILPKNGPACRQGKGERCREYLAAVRDFARPMLNKDGTWNIDLTEEQGRLDLQLCTAFYCGNEDDIALANRLTRRAPISDFMGRRFNIFETSIACHHLAVFRDKMTPETIAWCETAIEEGCGPCPGMPAPDLQFHGYNDNMPAMATKTLILGGEMLARGDWVEVGLWKLRRFAEQLSRYGLISEYNSPNYTPDTIHNLTTLAVFAKNEEARVLAEKIVRRLWLDLAAHWHPASRCPAGPFSRAYAHDFNNYVSALNCLVWFLFGPEVGDVSALEAIRPRAGIEAMHGNDPLEHATRMAWYAAIDDSLLDDQTAALFLEKSFPFEFIASAFQGATKESPIRKTTATSYLAKDFSLGTASFAFCGGEQTTSLYATGNGGELSPILGTHYLLDDEIPGRIAPNDWHRCTVGEVECFSHGTAVSVQHRHAALASYVPHRTLSEKKVSCLRLALIAPRSVGQFDGFIDSSGKSLIIDREYSVKAWYGARLGDAIVAFHPLAYSTLGLPESKIIARRNKMYDYLEIINYAGPPRQFSREELSGIMNGVAFEIASADEWDSPEVFLTALHEAARFEDQFFSGTRRLRVYRQELPDREATMLALNYSTAFDGCAERLINGRLAPEPIWQCPGFPRKTLPLMGADGVMAPSGLPWRDLTVYWTPNAPWTINN